MARDHVLGVSVAVVQGNTPVLIKGYGYDRLGPARAVNPETSLFRLGSVTKVFTWIIARQEIEAGRINLDTSIGTYVPADIYAEDARLKPVTLRALMTHSAGYDDTGLGHMFQLNPHRLDRIDTYMRLHRPRRVREPLLFSSYSNYGAALAALAVSKTSRARDVPSLMDARIFARMGMNSTTLREPYSPEVAKAYRLPVPMTAQRAKNLSDGFLFNGTDYVRQPFEYTSDLSGALSGSSSAADMARLMSLMLGGGNYNGMQLYGPSSANAFATPLQKRPKGFNGWASGLMIRDAPTGQTTYSHSGSTLWFSSQFVLVPELNLGIFITANTQGSDNLTRAYPDLLLAHLSGETSPAPIVPNPAQSYGENKPFYHAIEREYVSTRRAYGGLEGAVTRLLNTIRIKIEPDGRLVLRTYNGVSTYVPATADGFFKPQNRDDVGPARDLGMLHFLMDRGHVSGIETSANLMRFEPITVFMSPGLLGLLSTGVVLSAILLWLNLMRGYTRQERPSEGQARATLFSTGISVLWVLAILITHHWKGQIEHDPTSLFIQWPNGQVRLASLLALIATLGSLYQLVSLYFIFVEDRRFNDGWAMWQKVAHSSLIVFWCGFGVILAAWGALNPFAW
jgi:CubicO group peptidase (beta-lactamase class C family)